MTRKDALYHMELRLTNFDDQPFSAEEREAFRIAVITLRRSVGQKAAIEVMRMLQEAS